MLMVLAIKPSLLHFYFKQILSCRKSARGKFSQGVWFEMELFWSFYLIIYRFKKNKSAFACSCFIIETSLQKYMRCKNGCFPSLGPDQPAEVVDEAPKNLVWLMHYFVFANFPYNGYLLYIYAVWPHADC